MTRADVPTPSGIVILRPGMGTNESELVDCVPLGKWNQAPEYVKIR